MKSGRTSWLTRLSDAARTRLYELIDAGALTDREIFTQLNLGRCTAFRTFRTVCTRRRREIEMRRGNAATRQPGNQGKEPNGMGGASTGAAAGVTSPAAADPCDGGDELYPTPEPPPFAGGSPELTRGIGLCISAITDALIAGRVGKVDAAKALRSFTGLRYLTEVKEPEEQRAAELHEAKRRELRAELDKASKSGTKRLEYGDVVDLVDRVMTGGE